MERTQKRDEVAELRARVEELEREREFLNAIANWAPSLLCIVDEEGRVRPAATNMAFERTLEYPPSTTGDVCFWEQYAAPEDADEVRRAIEKSVRDRSVEQRESRWRTRTGRTVDVEWSCTPLPKIAGGPLFLVCGTDVTERNRHEADVRESRARIVAASDDARRKLERNLHDGAQQRLIALLLSLRMIARRLEDETLAPLVTNAIDELSAALAELREIARGIHPAALTEQGLGPALHSLAERTPIPVQVDVPPGAYGRNVDATAYYIVSEALANVAKYAKASTAAVRVRPAGDRVVIVVEDDGRGGADPDSGTGLRGLADRVIALDGTFSIDSPRGAGTRLRAEIPLRARGT
jgi:PAS domain S-box-containing protein